ncbi:MAG: mechanosensitive ion channel, partial [bacterium]|nr:mechanosensitive ion channel [bacterium]
MMKRHIALIWLITQFPLGIGAQSAIPPGVVNAATAEQVNRSMGQIVTDLFEISTDNLQGKLLRIVFVIAIVLVAKYVMAAIQVFSRFLVYNEWGPLRLIFRQHKRSVTLNALFINVAKYVVYFTAMGYILRELGVNYTTYLASLSLIGIAVGFGSQGLVQDVVTGFFILFENQFSVGDMVEISGQVGIVEDIGLRTTRLRNYFGAEL